MDVLGPYRICRQLGAGSFGVVYQAEHRELNKPVALKLISSTPDEKTLLRFKREAQILASLRHKNIVYIDLCGVTPTGQPYLVMEFVDGITLKQEIANRGSLPVEETLPLIVQICGALEYLHKNGIVHRDITPGNILIDKEGTAKLADFGTARLFDEDTQKLTKTGTVVGTPMYMSPESVVGKPDERADLYALGCVMYECLSGSPPYDGDSLFALMEAHSNAPIPECPGAASILIQKALAKNQADRYQSAAHMKSDIERVQHGQAITFERFKPGVKAPKNAINKPKNALYLAACAVAIVFVAVIFNYTKHAQPASSVVVVDPVVDERLKTNLEYLEDKIASGGIHGQKETEDAIMLAKQAVADASYLRSPRMQVNTLGALCSLQDAAGYKTAALKTADEAIRLADSVNSNSAFDIYIQKGGIYFSMGDLRHAEECYQKVADSPMTSAGSKERRALGYRNLSRLYISEKNYDKALITNASALKEFLSSGKSKTHNTAIAGRTERAEILELMGKKAEAEAALKQIESDIFSQTTEVIDPDCLEGAFASYFTYLVQHKQPERVRKLMPRSDEFIRRNGREPLPLYLAELDKLKKCVGVK